MMHDDLPIAVIGAGPVGLAAAAHLVGRGLTPLLLERGPSVGAALLEWGHVQVFSPWFANIDSAATSLLDKAGWTMPDPGALPTGGEIVRRYLRPLADHPAIAPHLILRARVTGITRSGVDKAVSAGREASPFVIRWRDAGGVDRRSVVRAVIDASGTWGQPNPMGADGLPAAGEAENADRIAYGIPDVLGAESERYAGRRVLVVGSGHSAINVVLDLMRLRQRAPGTRVLWALRRNRIEKLLGGGLNDRLPARGALGLAAKRAIDDKWVELLAPFAVERIAPAAEGLSVTGRLNGRVETRLADRIVVAAGFRPDLAILRELRTALDPAVEAPPMLAPLIDPNLHSCGTVPPHGARELRHPEPGFYIVGSKSYGRAPTFLMMTGYEQVRSVVAEIAGDHAAAREVRLVLPETGVCNGGATAGSPSSDCCGGPAPSDIAACCVADATAKEAGEAGCGCAQPGPSAATPTTKACCGAAS